MNKMSENNNALSVLKKIHWSVWLALIIILAVVRLTYIFNQRDGHHVDEVWSYGYANSYYLPHVFGGYAGAPEQNIGEWVSGDVFKDYITVDEDHRFSFDSVMYNKKNDLSPIVYAFLLHFVSSFFPGQFSWGYAFFISVLFYIPSLFLIFILTSEITDSKFCGYLAVAYYIFSGCGTANFIYLRVYHIFTFLTLLLFFLIHRILKHDDKKKYIYYIFLPVATLLGCLTHYYFLVIAFALTLFGAIFILCKKRLRDAFRLCYIMLFSVIVFFLSYTPALAMIMPYSSGETSSTGYYHYPYRFDLTIANVRFFQGTIGWFIPFNIAGLMYFFGIVVFCVIVIALVVFLFRNEQWMKKACLKSKKIANNATVSVLGFCKEFSISILVALLSAIFYLLVIPYSATLVNMGFSERYFFPAMSLFIVVYISIVGKIFLTIIKRIGKMVIKSLVIVLAVTLLVFLNIRSNMLTDIYKFENWGDRELKNYLSGKDVYIVIGNVRDMIYLSPLLYESDNVFVDFQSSYDEEDVAVPDLGPDCLLLIIEDGFITEEQKSELANSEEMTLIGMVKPGALKTVGDVIGKIEDHTGYTYTQTDRFNNFLGYVSLYECIKSM